MNCIHENEVNKIAEYNLLNYILNPYKLTKLLNINYSHILHVCMNTLKVRDKFNNFRVLLDGGCCYTIIMGRIIKK